MEPDVLYSLSRTESGAIGQTRNYSLKIPPAIVAHLQECARRGVNLDIEFSGDSDAAIIYVGDDERITLRPLPDTGGSESQRIECYRVSQSTKSLEYHGIINGRFQVQSSLDELSKDLKKKKTEIEEEKKSRKAKTVNIKDVAHVPVQRQEPAKKKATLTTALSSTHHLTPPPHHHHHRGN